MVFLTCTALTTQHAACASESDSITLAGPVSPRNLNAACLCVKVEPITILTEKVQHSTERALCLPPAVIMPSDVTVETWRWQHARTQAAAFRACVCACVVRALGRVGGVATHAVQHWVQLTGECGSLWLAKYKQIACQSPD